MSDFFVWDPKTLSVGVNAMDVEHQMLIAKMNDLHAAWVRKAEREELGKLLLALAKCATEHFADEEAYMEKSGYAGIESHKAIHKKLLTRVGEHVAEFEKTGELGEAFFGFLAFWLSSHIRGIDVKYGAQRAA
jgi:hemerythrin-like metal-binding protein